MSAPTPITTGGIRRSVPPAAAVATPVAAALAAASFHAHSTNVPRQLHYIKAEVPGFTGMVLLENASWLCVALVLGPVLTLGATWRAGHLRWWHSVIFVVVGVVLLAVANPAPLLMVAAFAVITVPMAALARFLWQQPSSRPAGRTLAEAGVR